MNPDDLKFHSQHAWVAEGDGAMTVGVSKYAAEELGDILFAELPSAGDTIEAGASMGSIESAKAVADIIAPLSGEVVAVNDTVYDAPEIIGEDPYGEGWLLKVKATGATDTSSLLSHAQYQASVKK